MDGIRRHLSYANVAATLALVLAMSGGAVAATGGFSSGGKLRACVNGEGGLRLLKPGKHCTRSQQAIAWNQEGPAGARGAIGSPGAAGPKGVEGPKGESGESANVKWASIDVVSGEHGLEPEIVGAHGVVAVAKAEQHVAVAFDSDITNCAVVATENGSFNLFTVRVQKAGTEAKVTLRNTENGGIPELTDFSIVATC
jgi:hypothetical protein